MFADMYCGELVVFSNISVLNLAYSDKFHHVNKHKCSNYDMKFMGFGKDGEQVHILEESVREGFEGPCSKYRCGLTLKKHNNE